MSRIDWDDLWSHHIGDVAVVECPCCGKNTIHRNPCIVGKNGKLTRDWVRGHIIPASRRGVRGPDIHENVHPICIQCNKDDQEYATNYHYMVSLKRMTIEEAERKIREIWDTFDYQRQNPQMMLCLGTVISTKKPCERERKPNSLFCGVHGKSRVDYHFKQYETRILEADLEVLWQKYYDAAGDEEASEYTANLIEELTELLEEVC